MSGTFPWTLLVAVSGVGVGVVLERDPGVNQPDTGKPALWTGPQRAS